MEGLGTVIVGAGQAGGEVASALRQFGYQGSITLVGDEPYPPYRRPPLSKAYLSGDVTLESLYLKPTAAYQKVNIECRFGVGVERIDREQKRLHLFDGSKLGYEQLVLATGGRARRLALPGAEHPNVFYIRTVHDIELLRAEFQQGARLAVIGGGYVGLEAASVGIKKGLTVTVIEAAERVLSRVTAPQLSAFYERVHRAHGVDLRTGVGVRELEGAERVEALRLSDGERIPVDLVVVGIGLIPNAELAEAAGLTVGNGIVVDAHGRTSDPSIYAAGDCALHENTFYGRHMRLESVPNASEMARLVAGNICGKDVRFAAVPWFWSDQYNLKLQMVGLSQGYSEIAIRGDIHGESFTVFYLHDHAVIAADAVNRPPDFVAAKRLVAERHRVSVQQLADESAPLKNLFAATSR